jgi:hypothetical protein
MVLAIMVILGFLAMLWLVLSTAKRMTPESFRLKATVTKWLSLDLEMRSGRNLGDVDGESPQEINRRPDEIL